MDLEMGLRVANDFEPLEKIIKNMDLKRGLRVAKDSKPVQLFFKKYRRETWLRDTGCQKNGNFIKNWVTSL